MASLRGRASSTMPSAAYLNPTGPPAYLEFTELLGLINKDRARCGLPPLDRWKARRHCEGFGIQFVQRPNHGRTLFATGDDLERSGLWARLQRNLRTRDNDFDEDET